MKVLLVGVNSKYVHSNLAIRYLRAYTKDMAYECEIKEFSINDRDERVLEEIIAAKADVVAFSTYIWNVEMAIR
ncbi:MAG: cobalamin-dependent protein, partial [Clostridium sp.]